jgi:cytochrome c-type biogenesis protein CcmH
MSVIDLLAVALGLSAGALLAMRGLRTGPALKPLVWVVFACIAIVAIGATLLYASLSTGSARRSAATRSPQSMVATLASQLRTNRNDLGGWIMLGRSYLVLKEYPLAAHAYGQAVRLSPQNTQALLGEAQALMLSRRRSLTGRAGDLIERALAHAPDDPQALFYGAVVALHRGEWQLARRRFTQALALAPTPTVRNIIQQQLAAIDRHLGATAPAVAPAGSTVIRVRLELAPALAHAAPHSAPLYLFVRDPRHPGAPLAVKRLRSDFPQTVILRPTDAMVAGRVFRTGELVEVIARVAPSGDPLQRRGDLSGQTRYRVGHDGLAEIRIDHVTR